MTDPTPSTPGTLPIGEPVKSSSPLVELGPAKAVASGVVSTVLAVAAPLTVALGDGVVSGTEWITIIVAGVIGAAAGFGIPYVTPTNVTRLR